MSNVSKLIRIVAQRTQHVAQEFLLGNRKFGRTWYQVVKTLFSLRFPDSVNADSQCLPFQVVRTAGGEIGFFVVSHVFDVGNGQTNFRVAR